MAKSDKAELLARWSQAEDKYRSLAQTVWESSGGKLEKSVVVEITKARVKADKRMQEFFAEALR
jgi:hypothetical protein